MWVLEDALITMGEHVCSSFSIKNDNGSEVCSPVNSLREISEIILCHSHFITAVIALYKPE